jgi:hypothetical protein
LGPSTETTYPTFIYLIVSACNADKALPNRKTVIDGRTVLSPPPIPIVDEEDNDGERLPNDSIANALPDLGDICEYTSDVRIPHVANCVFPPSLALADDTR